MIIGSGLETIGDRAFYSCGQLNKVVSYASNPPKCEAKTFDGIDKNSCILYVPEGSISAYQEAEQWKDFLNIEKINTTNLNTVANDILDKVKINFYDLNVRKTTGLQRGMNIVKLGNAKTKKVMVK